MNEIKVDNDFTVEEREFHGDAKYIKIYDCSTILEGAMNDDVMDPKMVVKPCRELWSWYSTLAERLMDASYDGDFFEIDKIAHEIWSHSVEIEYLCKI